MSKFTKGEWRCKQSPLKQSFVIVPKDSRQNDEFSIAVINGSDKEANAHLIAAAPSMYKMIEDLLKNHELGDMIDIRMYELLKKARGE